MTLDELIAEGVTIVQTDQQHDLGAGFRCRLYSEAGAAFPPDEGRRRRSKLAVAAIQKVLPLWEAVYPSDRSPHAALELVEKVLAGSVPAAVATREADRLWTYYDDLSYKDATDVSVVAVGYGAVQAIREALSDAPFGCEDVNDATKNIEVDPYAFDAAFLASAAYAGGATWQPESDAKKRLEFWKWWLTTAVPAVFMAHRPPP
jgi:Immunity protein Imm5